MFSASKNVLTEPRNVAMSERYTSVRNCWRGHGMLVYWRGVASPRRTEDDTLPASTGSSPSHRLSDGASPTRSVSTVQPARSDASGFPHGAPPRTNARLACPPKRIELDKPWFVKPSNLHGKQNCQPIPMAFAPDGPVMRPSEPSLRRFGSDRSMRSQSTLPNASIGSTIRPYWPQCKLPPAFADNSKLGFKRASWKEITSVRPQLERPRAAVVHRCWR